MIYLFKSTDFSSTFADNAAAEFRVKLLQNTTFDRHASISLLHVRVPPLETATLAYVYCSAINVTQVGRLEKRLLQVVALDASTDYESYNISPPLQRELTSADVNEIVFSVRDAADKLVEFSSGTTTLLLQVQ
jgi:hypothetical protein